MKLNKMLLIIVFILGCFIFLPSVKAGSAVCKYSLGRGWDNNISKGAEYTVVYSFDNDNSDIFLLMDGVSVESYYKTIVDKGGTYSVHFDEPELKYEIDFIPNLSPTNSTKYGLKIKGVSTIDFVDSEGNYECPKGINFSSETVFELLTSRTIHNLYIKNSKDGSSENYKPLSSDSFVNNSDVKEEYGMYCSYGNINLTLKILEGGAIQAYQKSEEKCDIKFDSAPDGFCPLTIYKTTTGNSCYYSINKKNIPWGDRLLNTQTYLINGIKQINKELEPINDGYCGVLDEETVGYIWKIYYIIIVIGSVVTVVLGILDFVGAAASSDKDNLKKAWKKFLRRFITLAVLLLLPYIIELIFKIIPPIEGMNQDNPLCRIGR